MQKLKFTSNVTPSLGVEIEMALVDPETGALTSAIADVLGRVPEKYAEKIKPELMQCYVEVNSETCITVDEIETDLRGKIMAVQQATDESGVNLYWTGTHPFSSWRDQTPSPSERYTKLLDLLQDLGRQLVTFGLHVHVGVDSGDKAISVCDRIQKHLPVLLALSANSPWWDDRTTGLMSHRSKIMETLPTAGLPPRMNNWSEYVWLVNHLIDTGFINSIREIWWDVRPHNNFGTVEVRICDTPGRLEDALALAALIQCLVVQLSDEVDYGTYQHDGHPMMIRQNKWRAARYGMEAKIVDSITYEEKSVRERVAELVTQLMPTAERLKSAHWLERVGAMAEGGSWAQRQLREYGQAGNYAESIRRMCRLSRLG
jgi:glutamate---cysteine ligase / carboxylate-amine ligase